MSDRYGRRDCDNGWRRVMRDYGLLGLLFSVIFSAGMVYSAVADNTKQGDNNRAAVERLAEVQKQRAKEMGRVEEGLRLVQEQNRLILQTLLKQGK